LVNWQKQSSLWGIKLIVLALGFYRQTVGLFLGGRCRFYPSCSHYAELAVKQCGVMRGLFLTMKRIGKCQPFHPGGLDFPPEQSVLYCERLQEKLRNYNHE